MLVALEKAIDPLQDHEVAHCRPNDGWPHSLPLLKLISVTTYQAKELCMSSPVEATPQFGESQEGSSKVDEVKSATVDVASAGKDAGGEVVASVAEHAKDVVGETKRQARDLAAEGSRQIREQARGAQDGAARGLSALADELSSMAQNSGASGMATELAHQASERAAALSQWLGDREPGDLLEEIRSFARGRPGAFLIGAAAAGLAAGRLTRGVAASSHDGADDGAHPVPAAPPVAAAEPADAYSPAAETAYGSFEQTPHTVESSPAPAIAVAPIESYESSEWSAPVAVGVDSASGYPAGYRPDGGPVL
jgi:hypothetical protein